MKENALILFEFIDKILNQVLFFVKGLVILVQSLPISTGWNNWRSAPVENELPKLLSIKGFLGNDLLSLKALIEDFDLSNVMSLASGQEQP